MEEAMTEEEIVKMIILLEGRKAMIDSRIAFLYGLLDEKRHEWNVLSVDVILIWRDFRTLSLDKMGIIAMTVLWYYEILSNYQYIVLEERNL